MPDNVSLSEFLENADGHLVPRSLVTALDLLRDDLCRDAFARAVALQQQMLDFKSWIYSQVARLIEVAATEYNVTLGGELGNVSLLSFDGRLKISIQIAKKLAFDEKVLLAKELIDSCLKEWTATSRDEIQLLIQDAFRTDAQGSLDAKRILGLARHPIQDERWKTAMSIIQTSVVVESSKSYVRIYRRASKEKKWEAVALDLAALTMDDK